MSLTFFNSPQLPLISSPSISTVTNTKYKIQLGDKGMGEYLYLGVIKKGRHKIRPKLILSKFIFYV